MTGFGIGIAAQMVPRNTENDSLDAAGLEEILEFGYHGRSSSGRNLQGTGPWKDLKPLRIGEEFVGDRQADALLSPVDAEKRTVPCVRIWRSDFFAYRFQRLTLF